MDGAVAGWCRRRLGAAPVQVLFRWDRAVAQPEAAVAGLAA